MRFGFGTVLWGRRIDDLDYCLDVIAACGYQGVEFAQHHKHIYIREGDRGEKIRRLRDIDELLKKLSARGLELIGLVGGTLDERRAFLKDFRDCYLYVDRWPKKEKDPDFHRQVQECLDAKINLALHPHWLTPMCRAEDALKVIKETNSSYIRLLMDTAHAVIAEDDPVEIVQNYHGILGGVHIKNWKPDFGRWSHRYANGFCLPGEDGIVNVGAVMSKLHERGYNGWIVLEQDHFVRRREQTALDGARWMQSYGHEWGLNIYPREDVIGAKLAMKRPNPFTRDEYQKNLIRLAFSLERCVEHQPIGHIFYREVARMLKELLRVAAVKVWAHNPLSEELTLVGCDGVESRNATSMKLLTSDLQMVAGIMCHPQVDERDLKSDEVIRMFDDRTWLDELNKKGISMMTILPLFNTSNPHQLRFIITIFSKESLIDSLSSQQAGNLKTDVTKIAACVALEQYGSVIAHWADFLTDELCTAASGATNHLCGKFDGNVADFFNELIAHIKKRLNCNCVTAFLADSTGKYLKPAGRSDEFLDWPLADDQLTISKYYEDPSDEKHFTWQAWKKRKMVFSSSAKEGKAREKRRKIDDNRDEILFAPLTRRESRKCLGVVRLHNKELPTGFEGWVASMFTDDDAAQLDAIIQAALPYLELLRHREDEIEGIARMVHEFQTPLVAIRAATDFMRRDLRNMGHEPERFFKQDFLGMVTNWADLMGHLARNAQIFSAGMATLPPQKRRTDLRKDIILPVLHQVRPMLGRRLRLEFEYHGFDDIPPLWVDPWQFQSVFFNLVSNACKYGAGTETVRVELRAGWHGRHFFISVSDWGKGIPEEIREKIFEPKFRAREVSASNVTGQGLGLYVVRSILTAHGGSIRVTRTHLPSTFEITLPQSLRYAPSESRP